MNTPISTPADLEKLRQQFNHAPYPRVPLEAFPVDQYDALFVHNLVTSYYLKYRRIIQTDGKLILDAGCGSGFKSLLLALANPGAKVIGIDISDQSIRLAHERLKYHQLGDRVEFHVLLIEDLPQLGLEFDYINCDEVLYLLPDPVAGLQAMKSVLKPEGILRGNLHSAYHRADIYRAQTLFKWAGVMEEESGFAKETVVETMTALKSFVDLKTMWNEQYANSERQEERIFANLLLAGDKGYMIPDLFAMLAAADLEFVSMVDWRTWDVMDLFEEPENLPAFWGMSLADASIEEKLRLYELLHPAHRLMDFWCTHPGLPSGSPVDDWSDRDWQSARVHLHPQLNTPQTREALFGSLEQRTAFEISNYLRHPVLSPVFLNTLATACLLPLWEAPQSVQALVDRYRTLQPVNLATLEPISEAAAFAEVKQLLNRLDAFFYVLLERSE